MDTHGHTGKFEQAIIIGQVALAVFGMGTYVLAPRADEPVTIVPISKSAENSVSKLLSHPDTLIVARGTFDGSYVIRGDTPEFLDALASHQVLVLNASAPGCGALVEGSAQ